MPGKVYIIGAGASYNDTKNLKIPLPFVTNFFDNMYLKEYWTKNSYPKLKNSEVGYILTKYFGLEIKDNFNIKFNYSKPNIEEVYSFIDIALTNYSSILGEKIFVFLKAKELLVKYISEVIRYVPWKLEHPKLCSFIVKNLKENDSIISFNWDLLFDRLLETKPIGKRLLKNQLELIDPLNEISSIKNIDALMYNKLHKGYYLKLHGSVNYVICKNEKCIFHQKPYVFKVKDEFITFGKCLYCGHPLEIFIVPPHIHKSFTVNRFSNLQAIVAAEKLSIAEEIIIIGYSFPPFDFHFGVLSKLNHIHLDTEDTELWLKKIIVVNPEITSDLYVNKIKSIFGLENPKKNYGHNIDLVLFGSIEEYIEKSRPKNFKKTK